MEVGDGGASTCVHSWVSWRGEGRGEWEVTGGEGEGGAGTCFELGEGRGS